MDAGWHALLKSPITTLWFSGKKWNSNESPMLAVTVFGEKVKPDWPTSILIVAALTRAASPPATRTFLIETILNVNNVFDGRVYASGVSRFERFSWCMSRESFSLGHI